MKIPARTSLLHAVAIGLSLASASLAHATGATQEQQAQRAAVEAHKAKLQARMNQHNELTGIINHPTTGHADMQTLQSYHAAFHSTKPGILLAEHDGHRIEARADGVYVVQGESARKAESTDLARAGIVDKAAFGKVIDARIRETNGGGEGDEATKAALAALKNRMQHHAELSAILAAPNQHDPSLGILHNYQQRFATHETGVKLGEHGGVRIEARPDGVYAIDGNGARKADHADLARIGIDNKLAFNAAVAKSLHQIAGVAEGTNSSVIAQQGLQAKITVADQFAASIAQHADFALIRNHHNGVNVAKGIAAAGSHVTILGAPGDELVVHPNGVYVSRNGAYAVPTAVDLARHQIGSKAELEAKITEYMMRATGTKGDVKEATTAQAARSAMQAEVNDVATLNQVIVAPSQNADIQFVKQMHAVMPPKSDGTPRLVQLAKLADGSRIEVGTVATYTTQSVYNPTYRRTVAQQVATQVERVVVVAPNGQVRPATIADLHTFGIGTKAEFDAATGKAVLDVAEEDLPIRD